MSDLIDRQSAIEALERGKDKSAKGEVGGFYNIIIQKDIDRIMQLPSAEPQIIRCKDCAYFVKPIDCGYCAEWEHTVNEDDFCSRAERRENEP